MNVHSDSWFIVSNYYKQIKRSNSPNKLYIRFLSVHRSRFYGIPFSISLTLFLCNKIRFFFILFLLPDLIPIKNSIDVSSSTRARKHSRVRKLEIESPKYSASYQKTYIIKLKLLWVLGNVLYFFNYIIIYISQF